MQHSDNIPQRKKLLEEEVLEEAKKKKKESNKKKEGSDIMSGLGELCRFSIHFPRGFDPDAGTRFARDPNVLNAREILREASQAWNNKYKEYATLENAMTAYDAYNSVR